MSLIKDKNAQCYEEGGMPMSMASPWFERKESQVQAYHPGGLYNTSGGGRTDNIANLVPAGAYVIPADVVSGLGEGNTRAGAAVMDKMFHTMPYGVIPPKNSHGSGVGIPPAPHQFKELAKGGKAGHIPIITAGGEFLISPKAIVKKFGSLERGHKVLDEFVKHIRQKTISEMKNLKGPKQ